MVSESMSRPRAVERLLTIQEVADRLNVEVRFVRRLVAERRIVFHKVGRYVRFDGADVEALIEAGRVERALVEAEGCRSHWPTRESCLRRKGQSHGASENVRECEEAAVGQMASACAGPAHCVDDFTGYVRNEGRCRPRIGDRPRRPDERCMGRSGSWAAPDR